MPPEEIDVDGRRALLAYGANASPEALTRKLAALPPRADPGAARRAQRLGRRLLGPRHPLRRGPGRGRRPAPARWRASTSSSPSDEQLAAIAATEGPNYRLEQLADFSAELEIGGEGPREIDAFISVHGPLLLDGAPVALAAIPARDRVFPS